jgi:hypothetical protein
MGVLLPPPRCLQGVLASPTTAPDILLDTLSEAPDHNRFFGLTCSCGGTTFSVSGDIGWNSLIDQHVVEGPVFSQCTVCKRTAMLFDPRLHGFDVELDHFPPRGECGPPREFSCPSCNGTGFDLTVHLEYPRGLIEALESGQNTGWERFGGREQDLFGLFTLIGRCRTCTALTTIASRVCA